MSQAKATLEAHFQPGWLAPVATPLCSLTLSPIMASDILGSFPGYVRTRLQHSYLAARHTAKVWEEVWVSLLCAHHTYPQVHTAKPPSTHRQMLTDSQTQTAHQHSFTFPVGTLVLLFSKEGGAGVVRECPLPLF